jgi:hypothetical protein
MHTQVTCHGPTFRLLKLSAEEAVRDAAVRSSMAEADAWLGRHLLCRGIPRRSHAAATNTATETLSLARRACIRPTSFDLAAGGFRCRRQRGRVVAATNDPRRERDATTLTPQWYGSAEALQRRADSKPPDSYSQKLGREPVAPGYNRQETARSYGCEHGLSVRTGSPRTCFNN